MVYVFILALHLLTACVTACVMAYAIFALWRGREASYRACAIVLGLIAALEVGTGTALALLSPVLSASALALHIFEYLGVCLAVEALIFVRMQKMSLVFPLSFAASPVLASVVFFIAALGAGF